MTSAHSHPTPTAKSPSISAPTIESEFDSISGVFIEAIFKPSSASSANSNCAIIGNAPGLSGTKNARLGGNISEFLTHRYHSGVSTIETSKISVRTSLK